MISITHSLKFVARNINFHPTRWIFHRDPIGIPHRDLTGIPCREPIGIPYRDPIRIQKIASDKRKTSGDRT